MVRQDTYFEWAAKLPRTRSSTSLYFLQDKAKLRAGKKGGVVRRLEEPPIT